MTCESSSNVKMWRSSRGTSIVITTIRYTLTLIFLVALSLPATAAIPTFEGVQAVNKTQNGDELRASWNAATNPDGGGLTYKVFISEQAGGFKFGGPHAITAELNATVGGLVPGRIYYVVVRAVDDQGNTETNLKFLSAQPGGDLYVTGQSCSSQIVASPRLDANLLTLFLALSLLWCARRF